MIDSKHAVIHEGDIIKSIVYDDVRFKIASINNAAGSVICLRVNKDGDIYKGAIERTIHDDALRSWWEVEL